MALSSEAPSIGETEMQTGGPEGRAAESLAQRRKTVGWGK